MGLYCLTLTPPFYGGHERRAAEGFKRAIGKPFVAPSGAKPLAAAPACTGLGLAVILTARLFRAVTSVFDFVTTTQKLDQNCGSRSAPGDAVLFSLPCISERRFVTIFRVALKQ